MVPLSGGRGHDLPSQVGGGGKGGGRGRAARTTAPLEEKALKSNSHSQKCTKGFPRSFNGSLIPRTYLVWMKKTHGNACNNS